MPDSIQSLLDQPVFVWSVAGFAGLSLLMVVWQAYGHSPRLRRGLKRARRLLVLNDWLAARDLIHALRPLAHGRRTWEERLDRAEGESLHAASQQAVREGKFEEALDHALDAGRFLRPLTLQGEERTRGGQTDAEARAVIQGAMLEEIRRLFSASRGADTEAIHSLITRTLLVQAPCREASFWQGLCHLREGNIEAALTALQTARTGEARDLWLADPLAPEAEAAQTGIEAAPPGKHAAAPTSAVIDPAYYLGAILLRQGQPKEALRYLTEANRLDGNCAFVTVLLGSAMIAAGADPQLAVRALQKALGLPLTLPAPPTGDGRTRGLEVWLANPLRAWVDLFPEGRSHIRKLAEKYPFACPLWGSDWKALRWLGLTALAQGLYRLGQFQHAADLFLKISNETAPSLPVVRGLGLALARLGKYDDAFKHLRIAHDMEETKDRLTSGYLALCGAKGTPLQEGDKPQNVAWAIRLVTRHNAPGDAEWVSLISDVFAEARRLKLPVTRDDQIYLCEHLLSIKATDLPAAQAYLHLASTFPEALHPEYAWLFCQAATVQPLLREGDNAVALELFARTFAAPEPARAFFAQSGWDVSGLTLTYLAYAALLAPGRFPSVLGPDFPERGVTLLLQRSQAQEQAGQTEEAQSTAEILCRLAPEEPRGFDRLAYLCHRRGDTDRALDLLERWRLVQPQDPLPLVRQAILHQQRGNLGRCKELIEQALAGAHGKQRARIAFVGARSVLQSLGHAPETSGTALEHANGQLTSVLQTAREFLSVCLGAGSLSAEEAGRAQAFLAVVCWLLGDVTTMSGVAPALADVRVEDPRLLYFAALAQFAAEDHAGVVRTCRRIAEHVGADDIIILPEDRITAQGPVPLDLGAEAAYLEGLSHLALGDYAAAQRTLERAIQADGEAGQMPVSPSLTLARAHLGVACFAEGHHADAARCWQAVDAKTRAAWKLADPLAGAVFLAALEALAAGRHEEAANLFRAAGKSGCRDRRLGPLLLLSLFQAGQQAFYNGDW